MVLQQIPPRHDPDATQQLPVISDQAATQPANAHLESPRRPDEAINEAPQLINYARRVLEGWGVSVADRSQLPEFLAGPEAIEGCVTPFALVSQVLTGVDRLERVARRTNPPHIILDMECRWIMCVAYDRYKRVARINLWMRPELQTIFHMVGSTLASIPRSEIYLGGANSGLIWERNAFPARG